jgi:hypothetical protein
MHVRAVTPTHVSVFLICAVDDPVQPPPSLPGATSRQFALIGSLMFALASSSGSLPSGNRAQHAVLVRIHLPFLDGHTAPSQAVLREAKAAMRLSSSFELPTTRCEHLLLPLCLCRPSSLQKRNGSFVHL